MELKENEDVHCIDGWTSVLHGSTVNINGRSTFYTNIRVYKLYSGIRNEHSRTVK